MDKNQVVLAEPRQSSFFIFLHIAAAVATVKLTALTNWTVKPNVSSDLRCCLTWISCDFHSESGFCENFLPRGFGVFLFSPWEPETQTNLQVWWWTPDVPLLRSLPNSRNHRKRLSSCLTCGQFEMQIMIIVTFLKNDEQCWMHTETFSCFTAEIRDSSLRLSVEWCWKWKNESSTGPAVQLTRNAALRFKWHFLFGHKPSYCVAKCGQSECSC